MSQEKKGNVHPIVKEALELAHSGIDPVQFDEFAIKELKESLERWFGHPDLFKAVVDLINLAKILEEEQGSPTAAMSIIEVVSTAADALQDLKKKGT